MIALALLALLGPAAGCAEPVPLEGTDCKEGSCPFGHRCGPDDTCVAVLASETCLTDDDCGPGSHCQVGDGWSLCRQCVEDAHCWPQACRDDFTCGCDDHDDCAVTRRCRNHACIGCASTAQCPEGRVCQDGVCARDDDLEDTR
ncbi:MAG: hypothetical protein ACQEXJ_22290 [Myxococcota bacterium]